MAVGALLLFHNRVSDFRVPLYNCKGRSLCEFVPIEECSKLLTRGRARGGRHNSEPT